MMEEQKRQQQPLQGKNSSVRYFKGTDRYAYWRKQ